MKFSKHHWERKQKLQPISKAIIESKVQLFQPNATVEQFELIPSGLGNLNIYFKISGIQDAFLLRIFTGTHNSLNLEAQLSKKWGDIIPMPDFLYIHKDRLPGNSFAIQRWIQGIPFYKLLEESRGANLVTCAQNIGFVLYHIAKQKFSQAGFFKNNLEVDPFDREEKQHPFFLYIQECLSQGHSGVHLGDELKNKLLNYVTKHQDFFPNQEPACLVHGDFNFDNILIDPESNKVAAILDWEFAFSGSYLFDIGTFLRFELADEIKNKFIQSYEQASDVKLPPNFEKIIKLQDLSNLIGLINHEAETVDRIRDVKLLINETLEKYS